MSNLNGLYGTMMNTLFIGAILGFLFERLWIVMQQAKKIIFNIEGRNYIILPELDLTKNIIGLFSYFGEISVLDINDVVLSVNTDSFNEKN